MNIPRDIAALDFETYWDSEVSVKKMTTVDYVRHPEMKVLSVAFKRNGQRHPTFHAGADVGPALRSVDWSCTALLCHHAHFDGLFLSEFYGIIPSFYLDTLSMGRALHQLEVGGSLNALAGLYGLGEKTDGGAILNEAKGLRSVSDLTYAQRRRFAVYNKQDVTLLWRLWRKMRPAFSNRELELIDVTVRMQCDPKLRINAKKVRRELARERQEKFGTLLAGYQAAYPVAHRTLQGSELADWEGSVALAEFKKTLGSSNKLFNLLTKHIPEADVPLKWSVKQEKEIPAFAKQDLEFQRLAENGPEPVKKILAARLATKSTIGETRCLRLLSHTKEGTMSLPVYLNYYGAHTGRWSGGDKTNLQNLPVRTTSSIRECVEAPPGYVLVVVDSSQIEARMLAWLAGQTNLLEVFRTPGGDPYRYMASMIYDKPVEKIADDERFVGKTVVLGCGYGLGWKRYRNSMAVGTLGPPVFMSPKKAGTIIKLFRARNQWYPWFWVQMGRRLEMMARGEDPPDYWARNGTDNRDGLVGAGPPTLEFSADGIVLPNGMWLHYPEIEGETVETEYETEDGEIKVRKSMEYTYRVNARGGRSKIYGGLMTENIVQALARIPIGDHMLEIQKRCPVVLMTHDEIVALAPRKEAKQALAFMEAAFGKSPDWAPDLPLAGKGVWAKEYRKP